jgi:hypothetical protein
MTFKPQVFGYVIPTCSAWTELLTELTIMVVFYCGTAHIRERERERERKNVRGGFRGGG